MTTGSMALKWHGATMNGPSFGTCSSPRTRIELMRPINGNATAAISRHRAPRSLAAISRLLRRSA
jgi:hypothetical protein